MATRQSTAPSGIPKNPRLGGKRPGSGRPRGKNPVSERKAVTVRLTIEGQAALKALKSELPTRSLDAAAEYAILETLRRVKSQV